MKKLCSKCNRNKHTEKSRYCNPCHAEYMRKWRKTHPLNEKQRKKMICRSYANTYLKRGKIKKFPCIKCGNNKSQMHHPDYNNPTDIKWYCRECHLQLHAICLPTSLE